jgi:coproporphyrinogen III oxidase
MSLPPIVHYDYYFTPEKESPEEYTIYALMNPKDWI